MVAQFNDQLKANEIHGIQLHERVEQLQEQLLAIRADLGQLPSYAQLNANLAALPDRFKQDCVDLLQYHVEHDQAPRLRPPIRPRKNEEPVIDKIAFLVHSKELLNHFSCIWDALPQDSFDVLLHGEADCRPGKPLLLALPGLPYDGHTRQEAQVSISGVESSRRHLGRTVDQATGPGQRAFHVRCGKIRLEPLQLECPVRRHSLLWPLSRGYFSRHTKATIVQIGYPRLDRYFTSPSDAAALSSSLGCAPDKKTVVWLPTHGAVSSLGHFNEEIAALTERYNVLVKVHPLTPRSDPAAIDALSQLPFTRLIVDSTDNLPLYQIADYMLFDYGGPPLAGIYTNKKMILLNIPGAEQDALIGRHSPDALLRNYIIAVEPQMQPSPGCWKTTRSGINKRKCAAICAASISLRILASPPRSRRKHY